MHNNDHHLSADKFIARTCALLMVVFVFVAVVGYLRLPHKIPVHFTNNKADKYISKRQIFIAPAVGIMLYFIVGYFEEYTYIARRKIAQQTAMAYYNGVFKFVGFFKMLILFTGILITAEFIHKALNADMQYNWGGNVLGALVILVPLCFMAIEFKNVKKAMTGN